MCRERRVVGKCVLCAMWMGGSAFAQPAPRDAAVAARSEFEAHTVHSAADYKRVMDAFRAVYHGDPQSSHAPAAIEQVAELLAEQGRELQDAKSASDAAGQCGFLAKSYPKSSAARVCNAKITALAGDRGAAPKLEEASPSSTSTVRKKTATPEVTPSGASAPSTTSAPASMARVTGIRHWSTANYTRVAIDLGDEVEYQAARVEHPDRIFFDLHHARLAPELAGKSFAVTDDGFLTKIRASQYSDDVTRVVLDVHEVVEYSAFLLPNPYRLIIDIHGKSREQGTGNKEQSAPQAAAVVAASPVVDGGVSSLPPMPVTDGSAGFGLPAKNSGKSDVAAPRVVIPSRPTASKPVPNTVTTRAASNGEDVAAVSEQPGKVEATRRPTSAPISERSAPVARNAKSAEAAAPAEAALPTSAGQTSLMRALGLKIGRIVIDAGHGGHDSGTLGVGGIEEKDVVLDVALRLGKLLHQRLGAEIVYTRADDTFIPLEDRTAIANKAQADLFISVHANSSQDASARGVEVYYLNFTSDPEAMRVAGRENAVSTQSVHELSDLVKKIALKDKIDESRELAADVDESLYAGLAKGNVSANGGGFKNRGVKKAPFVVLIGANMPSILAEISFVTNPADASQLRLPEYRERVAESLFAGVAKYAGGINGATSVKPKVVRAANKR